MAQVFVYGTLKRGNFNNHLLANAEFVGPGVTKDAFPLVVGSRFHVPYLLPFPGIGRRVAGEVYRVSDEQLVTLDHLEMHPHVYERQSVTVELLLDDGAAQSPPAEAVCQGYFLVRPLPHLLQLPHLDSFVDGVDGRWYVNPQLRTGEPWRFEVQTPPDNGCQAELDAWRKL